MNEINFESTVKRSVLITSKENDAYLDFKGRLDGRRRALLRTRLSVILSAGGQSASLMFNLPWARQAEAELRCVSCWTRVRLCGVHTLLHDIYQSFL